ncbi:unnamed protein product [Cuscuta campestris]|uniref:DUF7950 domain-containing protein n=1 Tax=Cuscuta campestris TaxID=132261 RepID=A0A484LFD7_9ASTE|nr:unnamed protein product [Cuscuta campestris]
MARYRPIAPKPAEASSVCPNSGNSNDALPPSISRSPFLRDVWAQLQARPTRTRKRVRSAALAPPPPHLPLIKRPRPCFQGIPPPSFRLISFNNGGFPVLPKLVSLKCGLDRPLSTMSSSISVPSLPRAGARHEEERGGIDLNRAAEDDEDFSRPVRPRPVRPVGSSIYVGSITPAAEEKDKKGVEKQGRKRKRLQAEEVEEEVETEVLPAVVSDSKNKVRLANSAYKEMVGQPECCWLDYTSPGGGKGTRIGGEVVLHFLDSGDVPTSSERFTCWVRIEWRCNEKKNSVRAFCDAVKLGCQSRDYLFEWRFHLTETSSSSSEFQV